MQESVLTVAGLDPVYAGEFTVTSDISQMRTDEGVQTHTDDQQPRGGGPFPSSSGLDTPAPGRVLGRQNNNAWGHM
jgi:hypothetical protein